MNQSEQLKRMRALHKDAVRLKDAIKDEINEILDDIAERRKYADECDERATKANRTWDGKQPDFWYEAGHIWMKATNNHRGQSVLVSKDKQGMRPLDCFEAERIAKLGKVTEFGDYACYNSDETKINHWPIAWAPCTQDEVDQYRGGKFVSVVLADKMKLVKEAAKDQPEQSDPLLDDPLDPVFDAEDTGDPSETSNSSTVKPGYFDDIDGVWVDEPNPFEGRKIEPAKKPEYREPTAADLADGPIEVEVSDDKTDETNWEKRMLYAVLPVKCMFHFVVGSPGVDEFTQNWKYARIKVDC